MRFRPVLLALVALGTVLAVGATTMRSTTSIAPVVDPNIVLILLDDADRASVEAMTYMTSLVADEGVRFTRAYAPLSQCCPSRASILTGRYVHNHKVRSNEAAEHGGFSTFRARGHERRTIGKRLRDLGYATALVGKYLNEYGPATDSETHVPPGWSRWFATFHQNFYDYEVNDDGRVRRFGSTAGAYATNVFGHEVRRFIRNVDQRKPFFAFASFTAPHAPYVDPPGHRRDFSDVRPPPFDKPSFNEQDMSDKPKYFRRLDPLGADAKKKIGSRWRHRMRMLADVDDFVRRLVADLEDSGELANTYIFITSDNGWMQGEHRKPGEKAVAYEESANVPLFVRGPGITPGRTSDALVSLIDLYATFAEFAGASEQRDGRSLVPLLLGTDLTWRQQLLIEWTDDVSRVPGFTAAVTDRHKYVRYVTGERELYDLVADPYELTSIHRSNGAVVADLDAKLAALRRCSGAECRVADGGP